MAATGWLTPVARTDCAGLRRLLAMRLELTIGGMLSVHAKHAVFTALSAVDGLVHAEVELGRAEVMHSGHALPVALEAAVREAVEAAGFEVLAVRVLPRTLPTI